MAAAAPLWCALPRQPRPSLFFATRFRSNNFPLQTNSKLGDDKEMSLADRLLDYIEGGPKLRKWYGAADRPVENEGLFKQNMILEEPPNNERDAVLVTDADSETGQLIVLSLILKRARVRVLVRDATAAITAFGSYIEPIVGDIHDRASLIKALQGVRTVIYSGRVGGSVDKDILGGVQHLIFLSQLPFFKKQKGLFSLLLSGKCSEAEADEDAILASGIPCTIVRVGSLHDEPGGQQGFSFGEGSAEQGISRQDAATICVEALETPPEKALIFEVGNGDKMVEQWKSVFSLLTKLQ